MTSDVWTIQRLLTWTEDYFRNRGVEQPRLEAQILLAHTLGCSKIDLYVRFSELASDSIRQQYRELIRRRTEGTPIAYLVGEKEFFSLKFHVSPAVLIPRPDTEVLVMEALRLIDAKKPAQILDMGTGSGCIAVTLAKSLPLAHLQAIDLSLDALEVAKGNAALHSVGDRLQFLHGDWWQAVSPDATFDLIATNPPYISEAEWTEVDAGVKNFEPTMALLAPPDGLRFYRSLATDAAAHLHHGGHLLAEIGYQQGIAVKELFAAQPEWANIRILKDFSGNDRVLAATRTM
ncbi:MAG: peptide chain release factor N(5)-glutamine methyltransferase [Zavarzinella sp.]